MRVLVTGSRDWTDAEAIARPLQFLARHCDHVEVLHGAARGADILAAEIATGLGMTVRAFHADWSVKPDTPPERIRRRRGAGAYDVGAGFERNRRMLDEQPDLVLAFQRDRSSGTRDTVDEARRRGVRVVVYTPTRESPAAITGTVS